MPSCGTITVRPQFDPSLVTASCDVGTTMASPGSTVTITATITNQNDAAGDYNLTFEVGTAVSETTSGRVGANGTATESITVQLSEPGDYPVTTSVNSSRA